MKIFIIIAWNFSYFLYCFKFQVVRNYFTGNLLKRVVKTPLFYRFINTVNMIYFFCILDLLLSHNPFLKIIQDFKLEPYKKRKYYIQLFFNIIPTKSFIFHHNQANFLFSVYNYFFTLLYNRLLKLLLFIVCFLILFIFRNSDCYYQYLCLVILSWYNLLFYFYLLE